MWVKHVVGWNPANCRICRIQSESFIEVIIFIYSPFHNSLQFPLLYMYIENDGLQIFTILILIIQFYFHTVFFINQFFLYLFHRPQICLYILPELYVNIFELRMKLFVYHLFNCSFLTPTLSPSWV